MTRILKLVLIMAFSIGNQQCFAQPRLINVMSVSENLLVEMPYATADNFVGQKLYSANEAYLAEPVAHALASAALMVMKHGYRLKILDAYRPLAVQSVLWAIKPDRNFVAPPEVGSRHNRGASVDVTLVSASDLKEVEMPSKYDEFGPKASSIQKDLAEPVKKNLSLLQEAMQSHGFTTLRSEWWHFDHNSWKKYPLQNKQFSELAEQNNAANSQLMPELPCQNTP